MKLPGLRLLLCLQSIEITLIIVFLEMLPYKIGIYSIA